MEIDLKPNLRTDANIQIYDSSSQSNKYLLTYKNKMFCISESMKDVLSLMDGNNSITQIISTIKEEHGRNYSSLEIQRIIETFLLPNHLIEDGNLSSEFLESNKTSFILFKFKILTKAKVNTFSDIGKILFRDNVIKLAGFIITVSLLYFCFFNLKNIPNLELISANSIVLLYLIVVLSMFIHELGHASAARFTNVEHNDIGIGLYLIFIVFYTDVTYAWLLKRKERMLINLGGVYFQLLLVVLFMLAYEIWHSNLVLCAILINLFGVLTSLNPFLKFDGYWVITDLLGVHNLHKKLRELGTYLIKTITLHKAKNPFWDVKKTERFFLYGYSFLFLIFIIFFFYKVFSYIPESVRQIISSSQGIQNINPSEYFPLISNIAKNALFLIMILIPIYTNALEIIKYLIKYFQLK